MVKVSIVMPVYNCETYVEQSIKSALSQTMDDLEVICVDDGSTDHSCQIIEQLQSGDSRIVLFHQENQGAGAARNHALQKARGKYIAFLDADDYFLDANALCKMYESCERYQIAACGSLRKKLRNKKLMDTEVFEHTGYNAVAGCVYRYRDVQCDYNYQSFIFLKSLLLDNEIKFPDYRRYQDPPFFVKALYVVDKFYIANTYLYCYRNVFPPIKYSVEKVIDLVKGLKDNLEFALQYGLRKLFNTTLERLEYEFGNIIYQNIPFGNTYLLELLLEINKMAKGYLEDDRQVRPLKLIYGAIRQNIDSYENQIINKICLEKKIYLYGAGMLTDFFIQHLKEKQLTDKIKGIVVSEKGENIQEMYGIPIIDINSYAHSDDSLILVTAGVNFHRDIERRLLKNHIENYELVDVSFFINQ